MYKHFNACLNALVRNINAGVFLYNDVEAILYKMEAKMEEACEAGTLNENTMIHQLFPRMRLIDKMAQKKLA